MRKITFLFKFYQPIVQDESTFRKVVKELYLPLIKIIKNKKDFRCSISMPLSFIEQMEKYGHSSWISDMRQLVDSERVELVGNFSYAFYTKPLSKDILEQQIILNEYAFGYYFGMRQGFEGEKAILIKDVKGFCSPAGTLTPDLLEVLNEISYEWVISKPWDGVVEGVYAVGDPDSEHEESRLRLLATEGSLEGGIKVLSVEDYEFAEISELLSKYSTEGNIYKFITVGEYISGSEVVTLEEQPHLSLEAVEDSGFSKEAVVVLDKLFNHLLGIYNAFPKEGVPSTGLENSRLWNTGDVSKSLPVSVSIHLQKLLGSYPLLVSHKMLKNYLVLAQELALMLDTLGIKHSLRDILEDFEK